MCYLPACSRSTSQCLLNSANPCHFPLILVPCCLACPVHHLLPQRLARENREQTQLIDTLQSRVQVLEADVQQLLSEALKKQAEKQRRSQWGGFFGTRAVEASG